MRRSGLEYSQSSNIRESLDNTRVAINRIHDDLSRTWSEHIAENPFEAKLQIENRLRRLESAYLETRIALRNALDDESQVLLFVLGAKIMHDIAEQSERYQLATTVENPVPESNNLREASLAWLNRGIVIATIQDNPSRLSDVVRHNIDWQSPNETPRREQLSEALSLADQYDQELGKTQASLRPVDRVELAA